jgi:hypothetical protein
LVIHSEDARRKFRHRGICRPSVELGSFRLRVAIDYPSLFSALILVDPVVYQPGFHDEQPERLKGYLRSALQRREHWPTR